MASSERWGVLLLKQEKWRRMKDWWFQRGKTLKQKRIKISRFILKQNKWTKNTSQDGTKEDQEDDKEYLSLYVYLYFVFSTKKPCFEFWIKIEYIPWYVQSALTWIIFSKRAFKTNLFLNHIRFIWWLFSLSN